MPHLMKRGFLGQFVGSCVVMMAEMLCEIAAAGEFLLRPRMGLMPFKVKFAATCVHSAKGTRRSASKGLMKFFYAFSLVSFCASLSAQYAERPGMLGSNSQACDASGRSIKDRRVRAIHTTDSSQLGGTAYLFQQDPYLAFQMGRDMNFREFRERDGVFDARIGNFLGLLADGVTSKITANNHLSCSSCHNVPEGNPGGGTNFSKDSGMGRQAPHYYGAGIVEMLAIQVRAQMLRQLDRDNNGWVSVSEAQNGGPRVLVLPKPDVAALDYGDPRLTNGATGKPQLNNIFRVWYCDAQGRFVPGATEVNGITTVGYNFEMMVWGWGQGKARSALNPTNRAFLWDPYKTHGGLESYDPTTTNDPDGNGVSVPSLAGAIQFPATHKPNDRGANRDPLGFSRDDPDGDGYLNEISEGDLDVAEWYMLNAPRPAFAGSDREFSDGIALLTRLGCTSCHTSEWEIAAANNNPLRGIVTPGDRRFFDLKVNWNRSAKNFEGRIVPLHDRQGDSYVRRFGSFVVPGFLSDLRQHDMGERCEEVDFAGNKNRIWRTPMLWGTGSGMPWMHDGQSLSLEAAILRHDGEGRDSRLQYEQTSETHQRQLVAFLDKLRLYDIESLPTDIDGDGLIGQSYMVAGVDTGVERCNAEWLFKVPVQIQGITRSSSGELVRSFAATNLSAAYGFDLNLRRDTDNDGWADVWDYAPTVRGYRNGSQ